MTGQDGNSAMKGWVEAVFGRPGQLWIDGRAANETLQLREENKRLRQENEILRKQRDAYQQSSDRRFAALVEKEKERAADLAGHYRKLVQERDDLRQEVARLMSGQERASDNLPPLPGTPCGPPLVNCDRVAGDVMDLSAPGMRAHCEHERPGESRVQMFRTDTGEAIADVTVHPINDEDLTEATLEIVRGLYFSWWRAEARDGRRWETT